MKYQQLISSIKTALKAQHENLVSFVRMPTYSHKMFCIGYNKTGTTTLGKSFELLGLRNCSFNRNIWSEFYEKNNRFKV
ncbi:MAG: hypothetical protein AAGC93_10280, partial [Cyanobacteria bacterium P01_F01_bin.53]